LQEWGGAFNRGDIWILDVPSGAFSRLTTDGGSYRPRWSRDGRWVYFMRRDSSNASTTNSVIRRPWDGSGAEETRLSSVSLGEIEPGAANGLSAIRTLGARDIFLAPTESLSAMRPFVTGPRNETDPAISPDGKWLAYQSDETDRAEVYLRPIPGPGARLSVSLHGGVQARWSRDGRKLFYRAPGTLMAAEVEYRDGTAVVTRRDSLFAVDFGSDGSLENDYDLMPDGTGFVFLRGTTATRPTLTIIPNWPALLQRARGTP
jgi:Tol biopolymer transport system component